MADDRDPAAVERFVERFTQVLVDAGMPRTPSRIFVVLLATDSGRRTAAELAAMVQASPAAISGGVRYLAQLGMVRRGREAGSRRDHFSVADDVWYQSITQREQLMDRWVAALRDGAEALGESSAAGERSAESAEFFEFVREQLKLTMERWRVHKAGSGQVTLSDPARPAAS